MSDNRNWFSRHKVLTAILAVVVLAIIMAATSSKEANETNNSNNTNSATNTENNSQKEYRFAERADKQEKDVEVLPGEAATVDGVKMTLSNVEYKTAISDFETADSGKTYVVANVALENTSQETKPYNVFNFRIQTAGGQVLDNAITGQENLSSGDLVAGGKASGKVYFEVPVEEGHQYVIWKPSFESDRAIVQVK